jgi:hypothetical protein
MFVLCRQYFVKIVFFITDLDCNLTCFTFGGGLVVQIASFFVRIQECERQNSFLFVCYSTTMQWLSGKRARNTES